jgi:hypothetical protein
MTHFRPIIRNGYVLIEKCTPIKLHGKYVTMKRTLKGDYRSVEEANEQINKLNGEQRG